MGQYRSSFEELNLLMLRQKELACFSPCRRMFPTMFKEAVGMPVNLRTSLASVNHAFFPSRARIRSRILIVPIPRRVTALLLNQLLNRPNR